MLTLQYCQNCALLKTYNAHQVGKNLRPEAPELATVRLVSHAGILWFQIEFVDPPYDGPNPPLSDLPCFGSKSFLCWTFKRCCQLQQFTQLFPRRCSQQISELLSQIYIACPIFRLISLKFCFFMDTCTRRICTALFNP